MLERATKCCASLAPTERTLNVRAALREMNASQNI
jgi:hypothetical protein